jgi:hypothetical protein
MRERSRSFACLQQQQRGRESNLVWSTTARRITQLVLVPTDALQHSDLTNKTMVALLIRADSCYASIYFFRVEMSPRNK